MALVHARLVADAAGARDAIAALIVGPPGLGIAVSGELPAALVAALARAPLPVAGVDLWFADEHAAAPTHPRTAYAIHRPWLEASGATVHRIVGELGAIEAARRASAAVLAHPRGPDLDLALLGLAPGGGTAALLAGEPGLTATAPYMPGGRGARITATAAWLGRARTIVFVGLGATDRAAVTALRTLPPSPDRPASVLANLGTSVISLADPAAGGV